MFSIHGITGQTFRGSLEHLIQVPGVFAARHARGINREGEELGAEFELARRRVRDDKDRESDPRYAAAAAAYAKSLRPDTQREAVRHAYQVMSRAVLTLRGDDTAETAWRRLTARGVRQAPVLEPARGVVGLVSERELLTVIDLEGKTPTGGLQRPVREVMLSPVVCADPVTDIRRIARVLLDSGLTAVPVVDASGELADIVSRGDILRASMADPPLSLRG
ncbi:MAG TPA: CBS domain-containing protein [Sulfuricaulis sp.]|nr:CBS domain-containing protein [Sulfuricaulis sp.]